MTQLRKSKSTTLHEIVGWTGVILILLAYSLVTLEAVKPSATVYGLMNLLGALGIVISSYFKRDFQPVLLNLIWLIVAAIGILKSIN